MIAASRQVAVDRPWEDLVSRLVTAAALEGERLVSIARVLFCTAILVRFLVVASPRPPSALIFNTIVLGSGIAFSLWVLFRLHRGLVGLQIVRCSVLVDPLICAASLLSTAVWAPSTHPGLLNQPDTSALPIVVFAAGLRLNPAFALQSGLLTALSLTAVLAVERSVHQQLVDYGGVQISFHAVALAATTALAYLTAARTRALSSAAARATVRMDYAREDLLSLMRAQHDARSLLAAAVLQADLVDGALTRSRTLSRKEAEPLLHTLREDLEAASDYVRELAEATYGQSMLLREPEVVYPGAVVPPLISASRRRFPQLDIREREVRVRSNASVRVLGGRGAFERMIWNLIENAAQGDGIQSARHAWIDIFEAGDRWVFQLSDDGPGFPAEVLERGHRHHISTKARGTGLGLYGVAQGARASGGRLECENHASGGAIVRIELPLAGN